MSILEEEKEAELEGFVVSGMKGHPLQAFDGFPEVKNTSAPPGGRNCSS